MILLLLFKLRYDLDIRCMDLKCTVWFILTNVNACVTHSRYKTSITSQSSLMPLSSQSLHLPSQRFWFLSSYISFACSWTSDKCTHTVYTLLSLVSFIQHNVFEIYSYCCVYWQFPFYSWAVFHCLVIHSLSILLLM